MNRADVMAFHDLGLATEVAAVPIDVWTTQFTYTFQTFFHPLVGELIARLNEGSLADMLDAKWQAKWQADQALTKFFDNLYNPTETRRARVIFSPKEIDVSAGGPYSNYNWELLFHIPLTIAVHLSKTKRFAEAQRWFHYIFDPTCNDQSVDPPARFWKFLAFRQGLDVTPIDELLKLLSKVPADPGAQKEQADIINGYTVMLNDPFQPHAVARTRPIAYQYYVVMKYLDNLVSWGDNLFQQGTVESINEATLLYVLAANLLGPRPQRIPSRGTVPAKTFAQLQNAGLDQMGNALVDLEGQFPINLAPTTSDTNDGSTARSVFGIGATLYFCIPRNDKLLGYWDTVADRLFKIRHCMDIEGVVRPLALFDPPIDPGMLVKAAAAGIDISSVVSGLNQPIGPVRCLTLIQKALELCSEVRGLGGALLSALEKGDGEQLGQIRQRHEVQIQQLTQEVKFLQWKSAEASTEALQRSRASALERLRYYGGQLNLATDSNAPDALPADSHQELTEENFDEVFSGLVTQYDLSVAVQAIAPVQIAGAASPGQQSGAAGQGQLYLIANEDAELNTHLPLARDTRLAASIFDTLASGLILVPNFNAHLHFWGMGVSMQVTGGDKLAGAAKIGGDILRMVSGWEQDKASMASRTAGHERRASDWKLQYNLAAHELMQIGRQILTSLIAEQIAHREYLNVQQQIANADEVNQFLQDKFSNQDLYLWMQGEISRLYYEYYRFAFDTARKAEQTMKQELMRPELDANDYVQFNYWDTGRKGLLSGEALYLDVKRMEMAYHDNNKREFELTRHISLRQLDPLALLNLKVNGKCDVSIPEWLYDRDCPGHYMRRLKSVGVSLPSVVGPFTSVNCTLSLMRSSVRKSPLLKDGAYARTGADDDRFVDYAGAVQSVVTSGASNDSGMFETNLRDDRFLPFEGAGAVSAWHLELPSDLRPFDYLTVSDAVLHVRYTARQGGDALGTQAVDDVTSILAVAPQSGLALLFSLRHDFPTEWAAFVNGGATFTMQLRKDHFPYLVQGRALTIDALELHFANGDKITTSPPLPVGPDLVAGLNGPSAAGVLSFAVANNVLTPGSPEVFLVVRYSLPQ